jgi:hypothetical protein
MNKQVRVNVLMDAFQDFLTQCERKERITGLTCQVNESLSALLNDLDYIFLLQEKLYIVKLQEKLPFVIFLFKNSK